MSPRQRRVRAGRVELAIREWPGPGQPFVLLHGLASNAMTWDLVATALNRAGHHVVAVDQRGHGQSDKPQSGYGFDEVTSDLAALVRALELEQPLIAGQSWGGNVVVDFASRYPHLYAGLVLVDGGLIALARRPEATWEKASKDLKPPNLLGTPRSELVARIKSFQPGWSDEQIELQMGNYEVLADGTVRPWLSLGHHMEILWAMWNQSWASDAAALIEGLAAPVLIALADSGRLERRQGSKEEVERLQEAKAGTLRWRQFEGAAHDIHVDQPTALAEWILSAVADGFFGPPAGSRGVT